MLLEQLQKYFGEADEETSDFIREHSEGYTEEEEKRIYSWIIEKKSKKFGFPDINFLARAFREFASEQKKYFWCICDVCGKGYDYSLPVCPHCYKEGKLSNRYKVRVSDTKPPASVPKYNKAVLRNYDERGSCYDCEQSALSFCDKFGNPFHNCKDFRNCQCKACCTRNKKLNRDFYEAHKPEKQEVSYGRN